MRHFLLEALHTGRAKHQLSKEVTWKMFLESRNNGETNNEYAKAIGCYSAV
jgi:hypothetical protein